MFYIKRLPIQSVRFLLFYTLSYIYIYIFKFPKTLLLCFFYIMYSETLADLLLPFDISKRALKTPCYDQNNVSNINCNIPLFSLSLCVCFFCFSLQERKTKKTRLRKQKGSFFLKVMFKMLCYLTKIVINLLLFV